MNCGVPAAGEAGGQEEGCMQKMEVRCGGVGSGGQRRALHKAAMVCKSM